MNFRERLSLDGTWQFQIDPSGCAGPEEITSWRQAQVPMPWQAQFDDLREQAGVAWYRRSFEIPEAWAGQVVMLHFGAVNYYTEVWLNGVRLGDHEGGYLPFQFEIGRWLRAGESNELVVHVVAPTDDPQRYPDFPFGEVPHGKQSWYGFLSGIWQSVWLERRAAWHIQALQLFPNLATGQVQAELTFSVTADEGDRAQIKIFDPEDALVAEVETRLPAGANSATLGAEVPQPLAWSPDHPHLYRLEAQLQRGGEPLDSLEKSFGFRIIEARGNQLFLNGELLYLRGALDQDYYPGTIATPPSMEFLEDQFRKAKEMGLNCLRCHIKVADPRYYEAADRLGLLIWTELPNWRLLTDRSADLGRETLLEILARDGHHPSIIIWTIINEDWGTDLTRNPEHRIWLKEMYHWFKAQDPTRLVVDNSPCRPNFHVQTDIVDYHHYRAIPDQRRQWDQVVEEFANHPEWSFSSYGDAVFSGQEPLILSEFGNWGLPDVDQLLDEEGREPWWFETGLEWGEGVVYPHGIKRRFQVWNMERVFGSWRAFIEATQWQEYLALKYEIEAMRRRPEIVGYIITEFTDVHWECNGLLDMERNPKVFHHDIAAINADIVIIPDWDRVDYWSGEPVQVGLTLSHGAGPALREAELRWRLEGEETGGRFQVPNIAAGQVETLQPVTFQAPRVGSSTLRRLTLELYAPDGTRLATNHLDLSIYPHHDGPAPTDVTLWVSERGLSSRLRTHGYTLASSIENADMVLTTRMDKNLDNYIRHGGRLLLLADSKSEAELFLPSIRVAPRAGTHWQGDWASSFAWVRRDGPFGTIPGGPLIDHSFDRIIPEHVLLGFSPLDFAAYVHAGLFVGWLHRSVALIGERPYGRGRVVATTFPLLKTALGADPTAGAMLDGLIALTARKTL